MSSAQKTPFAVSMNNFAEQKISAYEQILGKIYPCSVIEVNEVNAIVTVNFEVDNQGLFTLPQVTCPIIGSKYIRIPVQVGDTGICISASTKIGNLTGLGSGLPTLTPASNLGALVFVPIGNANWQITDLNSIVLFSPNGDSIVTIGNDQIKLAFQDKNIIINATGITINGDVQVNGKITSTGDVVANGISLDNHEHNVMNVSSGLVTKTTTVPNS